MTIAGRNKLRLFSIFILFLVFLFALISCIVVFFADKLNFLPEYLKSKSLEGFSLTGYSPAAVCLSVLFFSFLSFLFSCYIFVMFKKIHAAEITFFEIFLLSFSFESIRLLFPFYDFSGLILVELAGISRTVYFFRFVGILSLFAGSLFPLKNVTNQISYILFLIVFMSFSLAMTIPMNNTLVSSAFIAQPLFVPTYITVASAIYFFSFLSIGMEYVTNGLRNQAAVVSGFLMMIIGYNFLLFLPSWRAVISGAVLFTYGVFSFIKRIHGYYLWK